MNTKQLVTITNKLMTQNGEIIADIFEYMEAMLIEDLVKSAKKKGISFELANKFYKAEFWEPIQKKMDKYSSSKLQELFRNYRAGISALEKTYSTSAKNLPVLRQWNEIEKMVQSATDFQSLMIGSKQQTELLLRAGQALTVTENTRRVVEFVANFTKKSIGQSKTLVNTMQNNVFNKQRQGFFDLVKTDKIKYYEYVGPDDDITRPFCDRYVGEQKTEAQWKALDNGQIGSAWDSKGGYNCRHYFILVPEKL